MAIDARAVLEHLGDPADVDRELQRLRKTARVLSSQRARLIDRYPKQWVAAYDGKVRAQGRTLQAVMKQVDKEGLPREHIVVRFIDKTRRTMIL